MLKKIFFRKAVLRLVAMAVATGGWMAYFWPPDNWKQWFSPDEAVAEESSDSSDESSAKIYVDPRSLRGLEGAPAADLAEVLRFDVTSDWILRRWPRVSTGLSQPQFQGYRVPLVTGTAESDLAGSLTYYFNQQQQVEQITFRGNTGDARKLVELLTTRYKFTRRITNDPGVFVYETASKSGKPGGVLTITMVGVVKAADACRRFDVDLVMRRTS